MSDSSFYRAFEERYYAPRQVIRQLRQQYLQFVKPLTGLYPGASTFDLGCGRGEWLELMIEAGFDAFGVDLDEGMLQGCLDLKLPAEQGDAVAHLASLPDDSHAIISAFHVVEHITFDQLTQVVIHALRVLKPGGLLIMETPNPENIVVGTSNFYLDPTHQRPLPYQLLSFLPEYYGFARTKTLRLQESAALLQQPSISLHDVLAGASPDYAVIAQKNARSVVLESFNESFSHEYGLSLRDLSQHYEMRLQEPWRKHTSSLLQLKSSIEELTRSVARVDKTSRQMHESGLQSQLLARSQNNEQLHHLALEVQTLHQHHLSSLRQEVQTLQYRLNLTESNSSRLEAELVRSAAALNAVQVSRSWRLLSPVRWYVTQIKLLLKNGPSARARALKHKLFPKNLTEAQFHAGEPTVVVELPLSVEVEQSVAAELMPSVNLEQSDVATTTDHDSGASHDLISTQEEVIFRKLKEALRRRGETQ